MPDRFTKREFGFFFFDKDMVQRHQGFSDAGELSKFLISNVPSHSYYSTAYYRYPARPTMEDKEWLGAELIFDLDADHLEGADKMTYSEMLIQIRKEMINLVDSFLFSDFGFTEDDVQLTFSGGRGYHAHIPAPSVLTLGSHERRELVDYITCTGMNIDWVFPYGQVVVSQFKTEQGNRNNLFKYRIIPAPDSGGWKFKMRKGLIEVVDDLCEMDIKEFKKRYPSVKTSQSLPNVQEEMKKYKNIIFEKNNMSVLKGTTQNTLIKIMAEDVAFRLSGEVDKPVTPDIKRIIRLPGSVHGKTGLKAMPITRDQLTDFDPLEQAIPSTYKEDAVKVTMKQPYNFQMKGQYFSMKGETEVPEYVAAFLIGRKLADYGHESERELTMF